MIVNDCYLYAHCGSIEDTVLTIDVEADCVGKCHCLAAASLCLQNYARVVDFDTSEALRCYRHPFALIADYRDRNIAILRKIIRESCDTKLLLEKKKTQISGETVYT